MIAFIHGYVVDAMDTEEENGNGQFKQRMRFGRVAVDCPGRMTKPCVFSRDLWIPADVVISSDRSEI